MTRQAANPRDGVGARIAFGAAALPLGAVVEIEAAFEIAMP